MRKLARKVAHKRMAQRGLTKVNKGKPSFFSQHWRDYVR